MRLIDADELIEYLEIENADKWNGDRDSYNTLMKYEIKWAIDDMPTIKPVRCRDCKEFYKDGVFCMCKSLGLVVSDDFSCIHAVRKGDDE